MNQAQAARDQIAAEVRAELARQKMSVSEAARRLGWTQSFLQRRAMGDRGFEAAELAAVAGLLDVPVQMFFEGSNVRDLGRRRGLEDAFYVPRRAAA
jgi:transcriptional regulator with XRE-family HTH domain